MFTDKKYNLHVLTIILLVGIVTYPSTKSLLQEWIMWDEALSQGFACLALVFFFIWRQPFIHSTQISSASRLWIFLLAGSSCGWCLVQLGNLQLASYLATLLMIIFLLASCINFQAFKKLLPILGLFIFALPVWSGELLVELSSTVVGFVLRFLNLTLQVQDNQILTPWGTIIIADGCSGLRYLIISLLLAYLLCLLNSCSRKTAIIVFLAATILALITNWIRITLIVLVAYHTEMTHSLVRDHELFGWILFAIIIFPAIYFAPQKKFSPAAVFIKTQITLGTLLALFSGPLIYFFTPFQPSISNPINLDANKSYSRDWAKPALFLNYPQADQINNKSINVNGIGVHVELMLLSAKHKDEKVVPYMGDIYNQSIWRNLTTEKASTSRIEILEERNSGRRVILAYYYQVGTWKTPDYIKAKLLQIPAKLTNHAYFGFWSAQTSCASDCVTELHAIKALVSHW